MLPPIPSLQIAKVLSIAFEETILFICKDKWRNVQPENLFESLCLFGKEITAL